MRNTFQTSQSVNSHRGFATRAGESLGNDASQPDEDDQVIEAEGLQRPEGPEGWRISGAPPSQGGLVLRG